MRDPAPRPSAAMTQLITQLQQATCSDLQRRLRAALAPAFASKHRLCTLAKDERGRAARMRRLGRRLRRLWQPPERRGRRVTNPQMQMLQAWRTMGRSQAPSSKTAPSQALRLCRSTAADVECAPSPPLPCCFRTRTCSGKLTWRKSRNGWAEIVECQSVRHVEITSMQACWQLQACFKCTQLVCASRL